MERPPDQIGNLEIINKNPASFSLFHLYHTVAFLFYNFNCDNDFNLFSWQAGGT